MNEIKVHHQDGLIYFDRFRIAELMLLKSESSSNEYLLIIDIQSYDYVRSGEEVAELEKKFKVKLNKELRYVGVTLELFCDLDPAAGLDAFVLAPENDGDGPSLYFGWHVPLSNNRLKLKKEDGAYNVYWTATADDVEYYDDRARDNKVVINCRLNLFVFENKLEYQQHEKLKSKRRQTYFSVLRSLSGQAIEGDTIDIGEAASMNMTGAGQCGFAWELALKNNPA